MGALIAKTSITILMHCVLINNLPASRFGSFHEGVVILTIGYNVIDSAHSEKSINEKRKGGRESAAHFLIAADE